MYDLHLLHLEITWSVTMGIGSSTSWSAPYGWITSANGSRDFFSRELDVGTALRVDRMYFGGQFASGDEVTLDCEARPVSFPSSDRASDERTTYVRG